MEVLGKLEITCPEHVEPNSACSFCQQLAGIAEKLNKLSEQRKKLVEELERLCLKRDVVVVRLR